MEIGKLYNIIYMIVMLFLLFINSENLSLNQTISPEYLIITIGKDKLHTFPSIFLFISLQNPLISCCFFK